MRSRRASAEKWIAGVAALYGLFGLAGLVIAKDSLDGLSTGGRIGAALAALIGLVLAAVAIVNSYRAAYGWPVITYGIDYNGSRIGEGAVREGMEQPVYYWDPVIAPSGLAFYTGSRYPGWQGSVIIGGLARQALVRLELRDGKVVREERYLGELGERIRDVEQGPDGFLYIVTDSGTGQVMRIVPVGTEVRR